MRLLNEKINDDILINSFIDEFDSFDEFDIDMITKDFEDKYVSKKLIKDVDEIA